MFVWKIYGIVSLPHSAPQEDRYTHGSTHHHPRCSPHELSPIVSQPHTDPIRRISTAGSANASCQAHPFLPVLCPLSILLQPAFFLGQILMVIDSDHGEVNLLDEQSR